MTAQTENKTVNSIVQFWGKVPAIVRGIVAGVFVGEIGIIGSSLIMDANSITGDVIPWTVPLIMVFLWLYVRYFRGDGPPSATAKARRRAMGWNRLSGEQWKWAVVGSIAIFAFVPASIALTFRFVELPPGLLDRSAEIAGLPTWVAVSFIAMIALTAGVAEEAAFRGYMQRIITRRHGAWVGIVITALIFWLAHFNHESGPVRAFLLVGGGIMMGYLAYQATSIVPLVITHTASDIYSGLITRKIIDGSYIFEATLVRDSGIDGHFVIWTAITAACIGLVVFAGRKLERLKARVD